MVALAYLEGEREREIYGESTRHRRRRLLLSPPPPHLLCCHNLLSRRYWYWVVWWAVVRKREALPDWMCRDNDDRHGVWWYREYGHSQ